MLLNSNGLSFAMILSIAESQSKRVEMHCIA